MLSLNRYACCLNMKTYFAPRMFDGNQMVLNRLIHTSEKQIEKVFLNANHMYGSVKGIAGSSLKSVELLDLPSDTEEEAD